MLPEDERVKVVAQWFAEQGLPDYAPFGCTPDVAPYESMEIAESQQETTSAAPNTSLSLVQLAPLEEKAHYHSPDHPDQGCCRMCDDGVPALKDNIDYNSSLHIDETLEREAQKMAIALYLNPYDDDPIDPYDRALDLERTAKRALREETDSDSDEEYCATDSEEDELEE